MKQKRDKTYNIDQYIQGILIPVPLLDKFRGIMFRPFGLILIAEIASEGLLAPVAVAGVGDGGEGGDGFVFVGVLEELWWFCMCQQMTWQGRTTLLLETPKGRMKEIVAAGTYNRQGTMPTHAMPEYTDSRPIHLLESGEHRLR